MSQTKQRSKPQNRHILATFRKVADSDGRVREFVITDGTLDRHGTIIPPDVWDWSRHSGAAYFMHVTNSTDPDLMLGGLTVWREGAKWIGAIDFETSDLNPLADKILRKIDAGTIKNVSVGFGGYGHWGVDRSGEDPDIYYFDKAEGFEVSVVGVPSNYNAQKRNAEEWAEWLDEQREFTNGPHGSSQNRFQMDKETIVKMTEQLEAAQAARDKLVEQGERNAEQIAELQKAVDEVNGLKERIAGMKAEHDAEKQRAAEQFEKLAAAGSVRSTSEADDKRDKANRFNIAKALLEAAEGNLSGLEAELSQEGKRQARSCGVGANGNLVLPTGFKRDILAETSTAGAENVQTDVGDIIPFLHPKRLIPRLGVNVISNLSGNLSLPRNDNQAAAASEGEGDTGAEVAPTFDTVDFAPKRIGGYINLSKQALFQAENSPGLQQFAINKLSAVIDDKVEADFFIGGGTDEMSGVVDTLTATVSNTAAPVRANVLALETAVATANAEMGNIAFVTSPYIRSVLKTVPVVSGSDFFVWNGRYMSMNTPMGEGEVEGYRAVTSNAIPGGASAANYILYGNWNEAILARWGGVDLLVNPYTKGKEATIEIIANVWVDCGFMHTGSFGYNLHDLS